MHYSGMAAIPIEPRIGYQPLMLLASIAVAIAVAYVALRLAFSLKDEVSHAKKAAAGLVMGAAIAAMHYTGMAAAQFAPVFSETSRSDDGPPIRTETRFMLHLRSSRALLPPGGRCA